MSPSSASTDAKTAVVLREEALSMIDAHESVYLNVDRQRLIDQALHRKEAIESACGALATWTPNGENGRIPKDTYMVKDDRTAQTVDWNSSACNPMLPETFDSLWKDAVETLSGRDDIFVSDRMIGADTRYALPVRTVCSSALGTLFADNMFRPAEETLSESIFADEPFTMLVLPYSKLDAAKYEGVLRKTDTGTADMLVAMDFERRLGLVYGCAYCGCIKKLMFTVMNYLLPEHNILPIHCSANEGGDGRSALFLGLSGTGKTTVSNAPNRTIIADDECGWSDSGIANFENGCYAKMINLSKEKEPAIYDAVFTERPVSRHGCIVENAMVYPNGQFDLADDRLAANSRASYPMSVLSNARQDAVGQHPSAIVFLTADANGVLPPISRLTPAQAMLWFMMGYTTKLAGVEVGIVSPVITFSRFFGGPFMPRKPKDYTDLLKAKLEEHGSEVYLVNTGWTGGTHGTGKRIDIPVTRAMADAALSGELSNVEYEADQRFHLSIPLSCPGVDASILNPKNTWSDAAAYEKAADILANEFAVFFDQEFGANHIDPEIVAQCPGK